MNTLFFDDDIWYQLKPLTFTRPACELRVGIVSIREKWEHALGIKGSFFTKKYLSGKFKAIWKEDNLLINGALLPSSELVEQIKELTPGQIIIKDGRVLAAVVSENEWKEIRCATHEPSLKKFTPHREAILIEHPHDVFSHNSAEIEKDYVWKTENGSTVSLSDTVNVIGEMYNDDGTPRIFLEEGAVVEYATINVTHGPVYVGKEATIMEGSMIRGPFAMCEHAQVNMGAKIYSGTTLGPWCKAGGELNNVVMQAYSNKGHDGFLGNAVLGEWCNIGADTNNSNLKNNYTDVKVWSYRERRFIQTGLQFCGLIMGDHTKTGINTMFNTGTVTGVCSNIFGPGFPRTFIPSFIVGGSKNYKTNILKFAYETAELVMARRNVRFTDEDKAILQHIFDETVEFRKFQ